MGRNKKPDNHKRNGQPTSPPTPVTPEPTPVEPTPAQLDKLAELELAAELHAAPPVPGPSEPDATLAPTLKRAQELVNGLQLAYTNSTEAAAAAERRHKEATAQHQLKLETLAKQQADLKDLRTQLDSERTALLADQRSHASRVRALDDREQSLMTRNEAIAARESQAEAGFLGQRRAILGDLETTLADLRQERHALGEQLAEQRRHAEAERTRLDEAQAQRHRTDDQERSRAADRQRQELARELRDERENRLAAVLRDEQERHAAAESERSQARLAHQRRLDDDRTALEHDRRQLDADRKQLRGERGELDALRDLHAEDVDMLAVKVDRIATTRIAELTADLQARTDERDAAIRARNAHHAALIAREELEHRLGGRRPEDLLEQLKALEQRNRELHAELGRRLGDAAHQRLDDLERERLVWHEEQATLRSELAETRHRLGRSRIGADELAALNKHREVLQTGNKLLTSALAELQAQVDKYTHADEQRNPMEALCALDERDDCKQKIRTWDPLGGAIKTLQDFAVDLRHRIATAIPDRTLYYSDRDVRCFLGGLAMSRLMLLQGISGTGKTSLPLAFAGAIGADYEVIEVQAGWRDRQDLLGYFNAFHRRYYATNFLQALYRAGTPAHANRPFLIVLDEINLSRVEQFFADFLSALEQHESKQRITLLHDPINNPPLLMPDGRRLPIPPNVWFIGTANHDETTTEFADKTYDRAHLMELPRRDPGRDEFTIMDTKKREPIDHVKLRAAFRAAIDADAKEVEHVQRWLRDPGGIAPLLDRRFRVGWGNRLEKQMSSYLPVIRAAGGTTGEAVDHLLHTRVLRKLRDRHDVRHKALAEFQDRLEQAWKRLDPNTRPERSLELLDRELRAKQDEEAA